MTVSRPGDVLRVNLFAGPSAHRLEERLRKVIICSFASMAGAFVAAALTFLPLLYISIAGLIVTLVLGIAPGMMIDDVSQAEVKRGYTTRRTKFNEVPQVEEGTGRLLRRSGEPFLSRSEMALQLSSFTS